MKKSIIVSSLFLALLSCAKTKEIESTKPKTKVKIEKKQKSIIAKKISNTYGLEYWKKVEEIRFSFNAFFNGKYFKRTWRWQPKTGAVTLIQDKDTTMYNTNDINSSNTKINKSFTNDKYWLFSPFNLTLDDGATITYKQQKCAPISKKKLNKITFIYAENTSVHIPGDTYDYYYDDNFIIQEWVFRKSNSNAPSMITTWEDHKDFNGIKVATVHKNAEESYNIHFTDIEISYEDESK